ncbi:MAG: hypothetical protein M3Z84_10340 [Actinomycetota bacterium]|nr:hypothetical protein [Actinomycetota bacterium]
MKVPLGHKALVIAVGGLVAASLTACNNDEAHKPVTVTGPRAEPTAGQWKPWVLASSSDIAVPPPPSKDSAIYQADLARVATAARMRTPADVATVQKWSPPLPTRPWTQTAFELVSSTPSNPPLAARNYALVQTAMYDAVVSSWHYKYLYNVPPPAGVETAVPAGPDPSYPSEHAAIAGAASRLLAFLYPDIPLSRFDQLADVAATSRITAGTNTPADTEAGLALGRAIADRVIARAKADGAGAIWDGQRPPGIGIPPAYWAPPPGPVVPSATPMAATWKTWVLTSGNQFRPPAPPAYGTPEFRAAAQEVVDIGANLTPEQEGIAKRWDGGEGTKGAAGLIIDAYSADIEKAATTGPVPARFTVPRTVRALALLSIALADEGVAVWDAKFAYWNPRPETAISDLRVAAGWRPLVPTPVSPAYPSLGAGSAGAAETVMSYLLPHSSDAFAARAEEQTTASLWGGTDWRYDSISRDSGRQVGILVVERAKADGAGP